jgi:hypothetical protein
MTVPWGYSKRVLAGAIFGLYMAHLLYFLNPQVDITPGRLATVTIVYGLTCGLLFGTALWLLRLGRVRLFGRPNPEGTFRTHGFGFVVLAAFLSSVTYWLHLNAVRNYLPIGAVRILSKSTIVITVTAFLLLALWIAERNANRRTSRTIFVAGVVLIAVSSFFLYQRRESYRPEPERVVVANIGTVAGQRPVLLVAIRNLPYDWLVTMTGEGSLPFFETARQRAYFTRLEPFPTTSPKALWASLATGKLPYRHGVTGRFSYRTPLSGGDPNERFLLLPSGVGFRGWGLIPPVQRISAQLPAGDSLPLWSLFERLAFHAAVVNWPAAQPGSAAVVVADSVIRAPLEAVPPEVQAVEQRFNGTGPAKPRILASLAADLAAIRAAHEAAGNRAVELDVAELDGFGDAQRTLHIFSNELPPRSAVKGEAVRAYVEQLDKHLGALAAAHPGHLLVVVSPSGVVPPTPMASAWSMLRDLLSFENPGADDGFLLVTGPRAAHRENPPPAYVVDVVPTVLFAAGLPVAADMDGRVITDAFDEELLRASTLSVIQTYEAQRVIVKR